MRTDDSSVTRRLLTQSVNGSTSAFDELFERHRAMLRQSVELRMDTDLQSRVDPSDVVQESQLAAFERLPDFASRRPMPFRLWLKKTVHECLIRVRQRHLVAARRTVYREKVDHSSIALAKQLLAPEASPSEAAARREQHAAMHAALQEMDRVDREVLLMRYVEKLNNQEIGLVLELSSEAVSKRHGRALVKLQMVLAKFGVRSTEL